MSTSGSVGPTPGRSVGHFRAHARHPSHAPVAVQYARQERRAQLVDIGLGGAGLTGLALPTGVRVRLVLHSPSRWDPLSLPARVVWASAERCGVAFEPASDRDIFALHELLGAQVFDD